MSMLVLKRLFTDFHHGSIKQAEVPVSTVMGWVAVEYFTVVQFLRKRLYC